MPNQTEEMMGPGTVYPFPEWKSGNLFVRPTAAMAIGDACPTTLRAALLSRSPGRVHEMFITLTDNCFEVMMFRKWEPRLQSALNTGLIIADMTGCRNMAAFNKEK
ncbi:winged helix family transcriptional regulator, partial [Paenibacillus glucanolyticus]